MPLRPVPTATEKRILQERRAKKTGAILVPILEKLAEREIIPEDEYDFAFMDMLLRARQHPRAKGVFSPSMLGSCMRQAYFAKRGEEKHVAANPQANGYFLKGNFTHFQWQFACWKAHRAGLLEIVMVPAEPWLDIRHLMFFNGMRPGVEVRVIDGDFGGTIDIILGIQKRYYGVDFKGINMIEFQRTEKRGASMAYRRQVVGYGENVNKSDLGIHIDEFLLVVENKAGPIGTRGSPLALHETRVPIEQHMPEVRRRLRTLRWFDSRNEVPDPECVSTQQMQFQECPFSRFCNEEVRAIQREREARAAKHKRVWKVNRGSR